MSSTAGAAGAVTAGLSFCAHGASTQPADGPPVRLGIIGLGNRGTGHLRILVQLPGVRVTAVCDVNGDHARRAAQIVRESGQAAPAVLTGEPDAYRRLLAREDVDAVLIATPTRWHARMSIEAMQAGKHVGCEVPAGFALDELWSLVRTKEQTGRRYMLLENYLYTRENMMVYEMARRGALGDPYYAACGYLHDCRFMLFREEGSLDWWGEWASRHYGHDYPTHGLGPVSKWLGLNEGDRMTHCSAMMTRPRVLSEYARRKFGRDSPQGRIEWKNGDFTTVTIGTHHGRVIRADYDVNSPRPAMFPYVLQGTRGIYDSSMGIYIEGEQPHEQWARKERFFERFDHPYWREQARQAERAGHGGGDYFVLSDFVRMVRLDREPWIDVYDAASWSVIYHCSRVSIDGQGSSVEIPDFTGGRWRTADWRGEALRPS